MNSTKNPSGASILREDAPRAGVPVKVPAIDFAAWLKLLSLARFRC
jgi:hypothetical protein